MVEAVDWRKGLNGTSLAFPARWDFARLDSARALSRLLTSCRASSRNASGSDAEDTRRRRERRFASFQSRFRFLSFRTLAIVAITCGVLYDAKCNSNQNATKMRLCLELLRPTEGISSDIATGDGGRSFPRATGGLDVVRDYKGKVSDQRQLMQSQCKGVLTSPTSPNHLNPSTTLMRPLSTHHRPTSIRSLLNTRQEPLETTRFLLSGLATLLLEELCESVRLLGSFLLLSCSFARRRGRGRGGSSASGGCGCWCGATDGYW